MHACTINHVLKVVSVNVSGLDTRNRCNDHQSVLSAAFSKNWPVRHTRTWRKTAEALKAPGERRRSWTCWDGLPTPYRWGTSTCQSKSAAAPRLSLIGQRLIFINTSNSSGLRCEEIRVRVYIWSSCEDYSVWEMICVCVCQDSNLRLSEFRPSDGEDSDITAKLRPDNTEPISEAVCQAGIPPISTDSPATHSLRWHSHHALLPQYILSRCSLITISWCVSHDQGGASFVDVFVLV